MANTYTDWAKEIIEKVGIVGANKLKSALDSEMNKEKKERREEVE